MTGKVLDSNPKGILILILPIAVGMVLIYKAWRVILLLAALVMGFIAWDTYQWQQKCQQIDPQFNQLVKANQGQITQADLAIQGIAKGRAAQRYLNDKVAEYGAYQRKVNDTTVYYFITASTLGTIFDSSEPASEVETVSAPVENTSPQLTAAIAPPVILPESPKAETIVETEALSFSSGSSPFANLAEIKEERKQLAEPIWEVNPVVNSVLDSTHENSDSGLTLIQSELAKRLDTTSSTIARRKAEADFTEWSQSKDPDGLGWSYDLDSKLFKSV
jgi:hypothetical protein